MKKIVFLTTLIPEELAEEVFLNSKHIMVDAANSLQWHIYNGLSQNYIDKIDMINVLPIGGFPQYYAKPFVAKSNFKSKYSTSNKNISFCNIKLLRQIHQPGQIYRALLEEFKGFDEGIVFVYTISAAFMKALRRFKRKFPSVKICSIVADLPELSDLSINRSRIKRAYSNYLAKQSYARIGCIDAFVLLTKNMADYIGIKRPFCVVEGISTDICELDGNSADSADTNTVMYSGTLHKKYGIINLVQAFHTIEDSNYRLVICGVGDSEEEIKKICKIDNRIDYLGKLPHDQVLKLMARATVLINPRQNNEEFTKYSFPSKTMEYLSSGNPVIAYKLDGIPDEYDDFIFYVRDNSICSLTQKIIEVCELDKTIRKKHGEAGRDFVLEKKNEVVQTRKIKGMMDTL